MMNGEAPHAPSNPGMLEETLHQMNILIQENRDLKGKCGCPLGCCAVPPSPRRTVCIYVNSTTCPLLRVAASDQPDDEGAL